MHYDLLPGKIKTSHTRFMQLASSGALGEIITFTRFFLSYLKSKTMGLGFRFEKIKDIIVAVLIVKRGKYSQSFLNTSFFFLVATAIIGGPVVAENNPLIAQYFASQERPTESVLEVDIASFPVDTTYSQKPRDAIIEYEVREGDTIASVAKKFDISESTVKWLNDIKGDVIKTNQKLKIAPVTGVVHKVGQGESVYSIAKRYHTDPQKIVNFPFNDFVDLETFTLAFGQTLYVPDGVIQQEGPDGTRPAYPRRTDIVAGAPGSGNFLWPTTGYVSQYPIWYHMALDIANKGLPPVLASDGGTVVYAGCTGGGYGCHIKVSHNNGYETLYGHLSRLGVAAGQQVARGEVIGNVGSTGRSTGPHLHFEIYFGGRLVNPLSFLK